ncbi:MAG: helix-turn-helix transcriptional regulator [Planctomycetes bacterium]|nr:helix-turn-helix transcriptional regulator [Planctomycetota bacterium]
MANKWNNLKARMSEGACARVDAKVKETLASMPLAEIRKAIGMTQADLAKNIELGQGNVSKIENAADMYLTTLRKYIEALGGELHLTASFSGGRKFEIDQVSDITNSRRAS